MMTDREALVSLNMVLEIGSLRLQKLLSFFGNPREILKASKSRLMQVEGIGSLLAGKICALKPDCLKRELDMAAGRNLKIITIEDSDYPVNLRQIPGAPIVLYVLGELKKEDSRSIGVVGSRSASYYGLSNARRFSSELALKGLTIVSGMARGVDTFAHRGALQQGGRTIAVMGSGFNNIYPEENKGLAQEISRSGAVISEFPMDTPPAKINFPRRNRIISGLSLGVLVVEAARNSGALITVGFGLEQGREIFALPGAIDSSTSFGTNDLIKQGAKLVSCVEDIVEEFDLPPVIRTDTRLDIAFEPKGLGKEELLLLELFSDQPLCLDELAEMTSMGISRLSVSILKLQLKKMIRPLPGKQFISNG